MRHASSVVLLAVTLFIGCTKRTSTPMSSDQVAWPALTNFPCIVGRAATADDIANGRAAFVLRAPDGTLFGRPADVRLPQYAFYVDESKRRVPCVLIQAEEARDQTMLGARSLTGADIVGVRKDFELLGDTPPRDK